MDPKMTGKLVIMESLEDLEFGSLWHKNLVFMPQESFLFSECRDFGL